MSFLRCWIGVAIRARGELLLIPPMTKSQENLVRYRGNLLSQEDFEKARVKDLAHKNHWVRGACWHHFQTEGNIDGPCNAIIYDVPDDWEPDPKLLKKYRKEYNKDQKLGLKRDLFLMRKLGERNLAEFKLGILMGILKETPPFPAHDDRRKKILDSIEFWTERQQQK